jgi:hypothetical protein
MEAVCSSKTLVITCEIARRHNPENQNPHLHRYENLKTHTMTSWSARHWHLSSTIGCGLLCIVATAECVMGACSGRAVLNLSATCLCVSPWSPHRRISSTHSALVHAISLKRKIKYFPIGSRHLYFGQQLKCNLPLTYSPTGLTLVTCFCAGEESCIKEEGMTGYLDMWWG